MFQRTRSCEQGKNAGGRAVEPFHGLGLPRAGESLPVESADGPWAPRAARWPNPSLLYLGYRSDSVYSPYVTALTGRKSRETPMSLPSYGYQTIETMDPKTLEFSWQSSAGGWREEKADIV